MIYTGFMAPYTPELSRVSYDPTPLICENEGCGQPVMQPLVIPGEQIGRPERTCRVVRCLNCIFWCPYFTYFENDLPVRVEFNPEDAECHQFLEARRENHKPNVASLQWLPGAPDPELGPWHSIAGGEPNWMQEPEEIDCPVCARRMTFLLQFASCSIDANQHAPELKAVFYLKIEYYATLYLFECATCNVTASVTQCS